MNTHMFNTYLSQLAPFCDIFANCKKFEVLEHVDKAFIEDLKVKYGLTKQFIEYEN